MEHHKNCPKCYKQMQQGYTLDSIGGNVLNTTSRWSEGIPKKILFFVLPFENAKSMEIITYRCPQCGYLESYAF